MLTDKKSTIMVVDDEKLVRDSVGQLLTAYGYAVITAENGRDAIEKIDLGIVDIVLSDIRMPQMSGIELLTALRAAAPKLPVILMTAYTEADAAIAAVRNGAFDFITKPLNPAYLADAIEKAENYNRLNRMEQGYTKLLEETVEKRTAELKKANLEIANRLVIAAEYRDDETGLHIKRIGSYAGCLAGAVGMSAEFTEAITFAASMHDIGKVGISDRILLKPGKLTSDEFGIMKSHTLIGADILAGSSFDNIQMAANIARSHHERFDGFGYPDGLRGEAIPIEARIVNICDQYDALRSERPYKQGFSHERTCSIICEGDGRTMPEHFDPEVLSVFKSVAFEFARIYETDQS